MRIETITVTHSGNNITLRVVVMETGKRPEYKQTELTPNEWSQIREFFINLIESRI